MAQAVVVISALPRQPGEGRDAKPDAAR
jgi:hypothetical protein